MASPSGEPDHSLIRRLEDKAKLFSFFQVVRLLEQASPEAVRVGHRGPAAEESVRLRPSSSMAFQSADVTRIERREGEGPPHQVTATLMGLYGASSPLPAFYSEDILAYETQNAPEADPVRLLLDLFNHRLLSLLYRSWAKYRWAFNFEAGAVDPISRQMLSLLGVAGEALRSAVGVSPTRLLRYAGFITQRPKSATALAGVLSDYFEGQPVSVEQCVPRWMVIPQAQRNRLGRANSTLGLDLSLGESILDRSGKFRIHLGPFEDQASLEEFLPETDSYRELGALVRLLVPDPLEYEVQISVRGSAVPECRISCDTGAARLGRVSWLDSQPGGPDRSERFPAPSEERAA